MPVTLFIPRLLTYLHVKEKRVKRFPALLLDHDGFSLLFPQYLLLVVHYKLVWFIIISRQRMFCANLDAISGDRVPPDTATECFPHFPQHMDSKTGTLFKSTIDFSFSCRMFHFIGGTGDEQGMKVLLSYREQTPGGWKIHHNWVRNGP